MNIREHLDSICDVKVWWRKGKIKVRFCKYASFIGSVHQLVEKVFENFTPTNKVLYVCYHGDETTGYIVGGNGTIEHRFVLLRSPNDRDSKRILWRAISKEVKSHYHADFSCIFFVDNGGRCFTDTRPPYHTLT